MDYKQIKTEAEKYKDLFSMPADIAESIIIHRNDLPMKLRQAMDLLSDIKQSLEIGSKEYYNFEKLINGKNIIPF